MTSDYSLGPRNWSVHLGHGRTECQSPQVFGAMSCFGIGAPKWGALVSLYHPKIVGTPQRKRKKLPTPAAETRSHGAAMATFQFGLRGETQPTSPQIPPQVVKRKAGSPKKLRKRSGEPTALQKALPHGGTHPFGGRFPFQFTFQKPTPKGVPTPKKDKPKRSPKGAVKRWAQGKVHQHDLATSHPAPFFDTQVY